MNKKSDIFYFVGVKAYIWIPKKYKDLNKDFDCFINDMWLRLILSFLYT